ncbi:MAG: hypothetical protein H6923_05020 [Alphaproteobacteria bacterium]|nr:hypothetical protein [Alphaproteobacteria bacterium]
MSKATKIVKDGNVWTCEGASCASSGSVETPNRLMRACKEISREAGDVKSIESGDLSLSGEALADCNG